MIRDYKMCEKGVLIQDLNSNDFYFIPSDNKKKAIYVRQTTKKDIIQMSNLCVYLMDRDCKKIEKLSKYCGLIKNGIV